MTMSKEVTVVLQASDGELSLWGVFEDDEEVGESISKDVKNIVLFFSAEEHPELFEDVDSEQGWEVVVTQDSPDGEYEVWGYIITDRLQ